MKKKKKLFHSNTGTLKYCNPTRYTSSTKTKILLQDQNTALRELAVL